MQVVVARPGHLDRLAVHRLGQDGRLHGEIGLGLASEAPAEQGDVHGHVRRRHAQSLRHPVPRGLGRLEAAPHLALALGDAHGGGRRLHGRVREVRDVVLGLEAAGGAGHPRIEVPVVAHDLPGLARGVLERGLEAHRVVAGIRAVVPLDLQRLAAPHGRPRVAGDDRDAAQRMEQGGRRTALDFHHAHHARDLERLCPVVARDLAAIHRRPRHHGIQHPVQSGVDTVLRLAGDDVAAVDQLQVALADVAKLRRGLETHRLPRRDGLAGRGLGQRPVSGAPAGRAMHDLVVLRLDFGHGHAPAGGRRRFQHGARGRAAAAHGVEEVPRAARAVGVLVAEALLVAGRLHHAHALPVGFELVGDDHRHARAHALPHLGPMAHDRHRAVLGDGHEHQRVVAPAIRHAVRAVLPRRILGARGGRESRGEHEPAQRGHPLEKPAPAHVGQHQRSLERGLARRRGHRIAPRVHAAPPCRLAVRLTAARMRTYVPQRQMLPLRASSMSASVGLGLRLSSAVAAMICPA